VTRRDWRAAREKITEEGCCRVNDDACDGPVEAAHVLGRKHDRETVGTRGGVLIIVEAADTIPLCTHHHRRYDARDLDLLPYLTLGEQARAVELAGLAAAMRRVTGSRT
jgi:hypothetical protein